MIKIAICDDDELAAKQLATMTEQLLARQQIACSIELFFKGAPLLADFKQGIYYDLLLLDIEMADISGIDIGSEIRQHSELASVKILFVSSYEAYIRELFELQPLGFIDKPVDWVVFERKILQACHRILLEQLQGTEVFEYKFQKQFYKIPLEQILYFESRGRQVLIKQEKSQERFIGKLKDIEKILQKSNVQFLRAHQSFLVNYCYVRKISGKYLVLADGTEITIAEKRQKALKKQLLAMAGEDR